LRRTPCATIACITSPRGLPGWPTSWLRWNLPSKIEAGSGNGLSIMTLPEKPAAQTPEKKT